MPYAQEKGYPSMPIQIIVNSAPGAMVDIFFRLIAEEAKNLWKVPVIVVNNTAGGGMVAASDVAKAKNDGYTFFGCITSSLATVTAARPNGMINVFRDCDPVAVNYQYTAGIMVARGDSKFKSLDDVIDYAKQNPGKLVVASGPVGTPSNLQLHLLKRLAKIDIVIMAYPGITEPITQLLGGHVDLITTTEIMVKPHIEAGKMRGINLLSKSLIFPDIPTFADKGYPQIDLFAHIGMYGPKGLPPTVLKAWEVAVMTAVKSPSVEKSFKRLGYNMNMLVGKEQLEKFDKDEVTKYSRFTPEELGWK